jgi:hypothetical protein
MALNRTRYTSKQYIPNQVFECIYYPPLSQEEMKSLTYDRTTMSYNDIQALENNLIELNGERNWVSTSGISFMGAEGTEDVYKKQGLDSVLGEYPERQQYEQINWRILTNASHIDFDVNGLIKIGDMKLKVLKVVYAFSTGTTPNKYRFYKGVTLNDIRRSSPKLIIVG